MGQTPEGAKKAAQTAKLLHGEDFHKKIGSLGGNKPKRKGGFAVNIELAREAGKKGGSRKKGWRKNKDNST